MFWSDASAKTIAPPLEEPVSLVRLIPIPDGPLEVTGPHEITRQDGQAIPSPAPTAYLCRCGRSENKPFFDGSHARTGLREKQSCVARHSTSA